YAILNDWLVNDRQHFFWLGFGRRQEARAQTSCRKNRLADFHRHGMLAAKSVDQKLRSLVVQPSLARPVQARAPGPTLFLSQNRRIIAQHGATDDLDRGEALLQEFVVELLQVEIRAFHLLVILAELHDLEFAKRVDKIRRVGSSALGLAQRYGVRLVAFFVEKLHAFVEAHLAGVHLDSDNVARIAQQRVLQLSEA